MLLPEVWNWIWRALPSDKRSWSWKVDYSTSWRSYQPPQSTGQTDIKKRRIDHLDKGPQIESKGGKIERSSIGKNDFESREKESEEIIGKAKGAWKESWEIEIENWNESIK